MHEERPDDARHRVGRLHRMARRDADVTAVQVTRSYLRCDSCGAETGLETDSLRARLAAARAGWKYATRPNPKTDTRLKAAHATPLYYLPILDPLMAP